MFLPLSLILDQLILILKPQHKIGLHICYIVQTDGDNTCKDDIHTFIVY